MKNNYPNTKFILIFLIASCSWIISGHCFSFRSFVEAGEELAQDQVCYDDLGCFQKPPIDTEMSRVSLLVPVPDPPTKQNVHFSLFSCRDRYNPTILQWNHRPEDLNGKLNFDPRNRTIFLVHGYTDSYNQFNWMGDIKDFILQQRPCKLNVIIVDWSGGSKTPNYLQAVSNTRLVGKVIAKFIESLNRKFRLTNDAFTVMGHSLGGQISGFVGKNLQKPQKLRLIIGLDPAGPAFSDVSLKDRLNPDDAQLVISIHTNGGKNVVDGFGMLAPVGHYSFYPNGGEQQPGCDPVRGAVGILIKGLADGLSDAVACSHRRAYLLVDYDESKFDQFESMAYKCVDYESFEKGHCGVCRDGSSDCQPFGMWYDYWQEQKPPRDWTEPIQYYIDTRPNIPYSYFFYQIKVILGDGFREHGGNILLNITGTYRKDFVEYVKIDGPFEPEKEYTFLHKSFKSLGRIESINVTQTIPRSNKATTLLMNALGKNKDKLLTIKEIQVNYMNGYSEKKRQSLSATLKNVNSDIEIEPDEVVIFKSVGSKQNQIQDEPKGSNNNSQSKPNNNDRIRPANNTGKNRTTTDELRRPANNTGSNQVNDDRRRPTNINNNNN